ncbi:MAG: DUF1292 domain-containing protein [Oscillospiraceae bacterium]|nr:DUF1292 domain-containing protein [Candidatus Ruminococcus equi]
MPENKDMLEEYEPTIITLEDDLGNEEEFEFLDVVDFEGDEYVVLLPLSEEESDESEVMILKIESLDDETETYAGIDDDELIENVFEVFKERYKDEYDFE